MKQSIIYIPILLLLIPFIDGCSSKSYVEEDNHIIMQRNGGSLSLQVISDNIMRVMYAPGDTLPDKQELTVVAEQKAVDWEVKEEGGMLTVQTDSLVAKVDTAGTVSFYDHSGRLLLAEKANGRQMPVAKIGDKKMHAPEQAFEVGNEALYGLGQYQDGLMNWKNVTLRLRQYNQTDAVPFLVSTNSYGLLWDNYSVTDFNPPKNELQFDEVVDSERNIRTTNFTPKKTGTYYFSMESKTENGNRYRGPVVLTINQDTVIHYNTIWVPEYLTGKIELEAGKEYSVRFRNSNVPTPGRVFYNGPDYNQTTFKSNYGEQVDYYVVYGKTPDKVIAGYRALTGDAPLFSKSAYGFWQCRERYSTQEELLDNATQYRKRNIPVDNIVQDWNYWPEETWGPQWDRERYPDPKGMADSLEAMNLQLMVSVWPKITNAGLEEKYNLGAHKMDNTEGYLDLWNPDARQGYYEMLNDSMYALGVDAIWLDGTEPEDQPTEEQTYFGPFGQYALTYPLEATKALYEGHRKDYPNERVFTLTRSSFSGMQRFGAVYWTGDISGTWEQFREQIPGGLNFSMAGLPYWTTDIGGFFRDRISANPVYDSQYTNPEYRELLTRWFEFGAFSPIFRIHGYISDTEVWRYGNDFEQTARKYLDIRYQLMPYIYGMAAKVTHERDIMMKPLVYAYPDDEKTWNISDQYLFGSSFLINPVTQYQARSRSVYLPKGTWYNFWNGEQVNGGTTLTVDASLDEMPIFVKAGSIIPVGPKVQYATQPVDEPMRLFIYPGKDGTYELYEDDGKTYRYEQQEYTRIPLSWDNQKKELTIGERSGSFEGMEEKKSFEIILVKPGKVNGLENQKSDTLITYKGQKQTISLN